MIVKPTAQPLTTLWAESKKDVASLLTSTRDDPNRDQLTYSLTNGVALIRAVRPENKKDSAALNSAMEKLNLAAEVFASAGGTLEDALGELLYQQSKQTAQRSRLAKTQIKAHFTRLEQQTLRQLAAIKKRIEAQKRSSFWDVIGDVFKTIGGVCAAAAGIVSGNPLLVSGAALTFASLVTAHTTRGDEGRWLTFGLGIAGAACCATGSFCAPRLPLLSKVATALRLPQGSTALRLVGITAAATQGTAAATQIPRGLAQRDLLAAEADHTDSQALAQHLLQQTDDEREVLKLWHAAEQQGAQLVLRALNNLDRGRQAALPHDEEGARG